MSSQDNGERYIGVLNKLSGKNMLTALRVSFGKPSLALYMLKSIFNHKKALKRRKFWKSKNIHVPPFIIFSITGKCNLNCKGCYAQFLPRREETDISSSKFMSIVNQAYDLGVFMIFLAGGEPLMRKDILAITRENRNIIFPVFTNGLLLNTDLINTFEKQKNIIILLSMEGDRAETDNIRGEGIFDNINRTTVKLQNRNILWGLSITVTTQNFSYVFDDSFIRKFIKQGCGIFIFVEYVPIKEETNNLVLTNEQRTILLESMEEFRRKLKAIFMAFPGDEEKYGGCLAAGRGFIHISAGGAVEPCPFAPYSEGNLHDMDLKEALQSEFLKEIGNNHDKLSETSGGCALWQNKEWVQSLLK